jgi:hypothetical protein
MKKVMVKSYGRWVSQHRYVAECRLGRKLERSELVHHINRDPSDNRPENLLIVSHTEHSRLHKSDIQRAKMNGFYRRQEGLEASAEIEDIDPQPQAINYLSWLITIRDLAAITGLSRAYFLKHISLEDKLGRDEEKPAIPLMFKMGHYRCTLESLLEWLESRESGSTSPNTRKQK